MTKKVLLTAVALMGLCSLQVYSVGLGVEGTFGVGGYGAYGLGGFMLTVKFDNAPYLGIGADFGQWGGNLGLTADWWLINNRIGGPVYWYLGIGPYLGMRWYDTVYYAYRYPGHPTIGLQAGLRVPIGLHFFATKWFELFGEFAPSIGVGFWGYDGTVVYPDWHLQGAIGVRFWF